MAATGSVLQVNAAELAVSARWGCPVLGVTTKSARGRA
jgi:hypothetical protein